MLAQRAHLQRLAQSGCHLLGSRERGSLARFMLMIFNPWAWPGWQGFNIFNIKLGSSMRTVMRCLCLQHSCDHTPKSRSCLAPTTSCGCRRFICWEAVTKPCITVEMLLRRPPALYLCHLHLDAFASLFDFRFRQRRISARFMLWETVTLSRAKPWITLGQWFTGLPGCEPKG
jgi:hypothetical protein